MNHFLLIGSQDSITASQFLETDDLDAFLWPNLVSLEITSSNFYCSEALRKGIHEYERSETDMLPCSTYLTPHLSLLPAHNSNDTLPPSVQHPEMNLTPSHQLPKYTRSH